MNHLKSDVVLPQPYLLFLGDTTEPGYAKTAFGLRDWAGERCVGEFAIDGATVTTGGSPVEGPGTFFEPTVVSDVQPGSDILREEIFGPVLAVIPFDDDAEAVRIANGTEFGLTAAIWTSDHARGLRLAQGVKSGTIWINDNYQQNVEGIWGGFKMSGTGRELSEHGILEMTELKEIYSDGTGATMKPHYLQVLNPS